MKHYGKAIQKVWYGNCLSNEASAGAVIHSNGRLITLLARGASNANWHSGCLAPDHYVESIL